MAKKTVKKANPKNDAKIKAMEILKETMKENDFTVYDNDIFTANLTASTFIVDVDGIDVKIVLSVPNGDVTNTRYERESEDELESEE
jgi:hypothetical protein